MQNRPNRCVFAMTDFSAIKSIGHLAEHLVGYIVDELSFHRNVPRGTLGMSRECSTWNIIPDLRVRGTKCSTWNTSRS
jgi:hypothetical protein